MLQYNLADMRSTDGASLMYQVAANAFEYADIISRIIEKISTYKEMYRKLPSEYLIVYLRFSLRETLYPFIRQACVIEWYKRNGKPIDKKDSLVFVPNEDIFPQLKAEWRFGDVNIELVSPLRFVFMFPQLSLSQINTRFRRSAKLILQSLERIKKYDAARQRSKEGLIACHYTEGIDTKRRNDLHWYHGSGIIPERILIYLDLNQTTSTRFRLGKLISKEVIKEIEREGFQWVAIERNVFEGQRFAYWHPSKLPSNLLMKDNPGQSKLDKWLIAQANTLLKAVHYWRCFYDDFNIKVQYMPDEGNFDSLAQAIACDLDKRVLIGKQRSESSPHKWHPARYPRHVFFAWNKRVKDHLAVNHEQVGTLVISGYPNDIMQIPKTENETSILKSKGTNFLITLFDNVYGADCIFSQGGMEEFYKSFLQWILDDSSIGLVIKSKKPYVIDNLFSIRLLLNKAINTGRCIRITDEWGRFPCHASSGVDIAVGVGISSALIESVIAGCKGIHYDMTNLKSHEFYRWGYNRIIFNDLSVMLKSLKRYKANPESEPQLGDWSPYLNELDPFRDGIGGERMGTYMHWLLEAYDKGKNRDEAIQYANGLYAKQWGEDTIINTRQRHE